PAVEHVERPARADVRPRFGVQVAAPLAAGGASATAHPGSSASEPPATEARWWPRLARRLGTPAGPALGALVLSAAILQGGAAMIGPASPIWLVRYLGAPSSFLGIVSLASSLAAIGAQRLWARWIDRSGPDRVLGVTGALAALIPLGWLLVWHPWVAIPISALGGMAWSGYSLAMTSRLLQMAPAGERPAYLGTYAAAVGASGAIGALLAGAITTALPIPWIPLVFLLSFLTRTLGWRSLSRSA
ncbi:MAG: MFS transporter, partial [Chloroflexota bacterium]